MKVGDWVIHKTSNDWPKWVLWSAGPYRIKSQIGMCFYIDIFKNNGDLYIGNYLISNSENDVFKICAPPKSEWFEVDGDYDASK